MRKLHLNAEDLKVESFPTVAETKEAGTVYAFNETLVPPSCPVACQTVDDTLCGLTWACE